MWKNRFIYIVLLLGTLFLSIMYLEFFPVLLLLIEIMLPLLLLCLLIPSVFAVKVKYNVDKEYFELGEQIKIYIQTKNNFILPIPFVALVSVIHYKDRIKRIKKKEIISLSGKGVINSELIFTPTECGRVHLEVKKVVIADFFGLFCFRKKVGNPIEVIVLPKLLFMQAELSEYTNYFTMEGEEFDMHKAGDDPSEIFQIREFQKGDRLQRVHWKLSVKSDNLLVKDLSKPLGWPVLIMVDLRSGKKINKLILQVIMAISCTLSQLPTRHVVAWYDERKSEIYKGYVRGEDDVVEQIKMLIDCKGSNHKKWILDLFEKEFPESYFSHLIYVTNQINLNEISTIGDCPLANKKTVFYMSNGGNVSEELAQLMLTYNITLINLNYKTIEEDLLSTYLCI